MSGGMRLLLRVRVDDSKREEFLAFLRRAIPHYEQPGGIRIALWRSEQDPRSYIELVEYADRAAFDRDQHRVEHEARMRDLLAEWRALLAGAPGVEVYAEDAGNWRPEPPELPLIDTDRLVLRAFRTAEAPRVAELANDRHIAENTLLLPHPYLESDARAWFAMHHPQVTGGRGPTYAITPQDSPDRGAVVGAIGLMVASEHKRAEIGYWIGAPYRDRGYATEAARALISHAFERLGLERIFAGHYDSNPASGRVLQKCGMTYEGCHRRHVFRMGVWQDCRMYAILKSEFEQTRGEPARD